MEVWKFHKRLSAEQLEDRCKQIFIEGCVCDKGENKVIVKTMDGFEVVRNGKVKQKKQGLCPLLFL